jgi:hypothetical protein
VVAEEFADLPGVTHVVIYGSWAARYAGIDGPAPADVDVLVVGNPARAKVYTAAERAEAGLGMPVNPTVRATSRWVSGDDPLVATIQGGAHLDVTADDPSPVDTSTRTTSPTAHSPVRCRCEWIADRRRRDRRAARGPVAAAGHRGPAAAGTAGLARARQTLASAQVLLPDDPGSAFDLAYDAVRQACTALLAHQGLRPTVSGGHVAVEHAVRAQFGTTFAPYGGLRRRRNEVEYPSHPSEAVEHDEAAAALEAAETITAAEKPLPHLTLFSG